MTRTLQEVRPSLPASWYYDPDHYKLELEEIWYRDWICVGHVDALTQTGDYFTATIGDQSIIVTRATNG
ncbi:MAG: Rieske (2Fe-2S) protein, partial [Gammaproteobacteria bacterium]|nr:Rieske (2Fe-2S) protein [Gammaproteobacteria bacterium]